MHKAARTIVIWITGLLLCGVFGAIVSNSMLFPDYGAAVSVWGFIAGALVFAIVRLGYTASQRLNTTPDKRI
jgi:uncharacterized membrane protein YdcZ (DUF606 family)